MLKEVPHRDAVDPTPPDAGLPWAVALNATDEHDEIAVTLLTLAMVDDLMRLTGVLRVRTRSDLRIATIPSLEVALPDGTAVRLVDARMQPHGRVNWVSWTYERPRVVPGLFQARIARIELKHQVGGTARVDVTGPWAYSFSDRPPASVEDAAGSDDTAGRA